MKQPIGDVHRNRLGSPAFVLLRQIIVAFMSVGLIHEEE